MDIILMISWKFCYEQHYIDANSFTFQIKKIYISVNSLELLHWVTTILMTSISMRLRYSLECEGTLEQHPR